MTVVSFVRPDFTMNPTWFQIPDPPVSVSRVLVLQVCKAMWVPVHELYTNIEGLTDFSFHLVQFWPF